MRVKTDPAVERLIMVITFVMVFFMAARTAVDTDMWWHLRAGEETLRTGQPYLVDTLSYTRAGQAWINHSWLSQVGMFLLYRWQGSLTLSLVMALLATASMALVYFQMEGPALYKLPLMILGCSVAALVWTPRPQLASLFLMTLVGYLLYLFKWKQRSLLYLLPPIFLVWSNLHGGYPLGLMLVGLLAAGEALNHLLGVRGPQILSWKSILQLLLWAVISILVLLINPNGVDTWRIPFQTVGVETLQRSIEEWASPDFHDISQQPFLVLLFATLAALGLSGRRVDASDLLLVIWFPVLALVARRNYGPFAVTALPVLARYLWLAFQSWGEQSSQTELFQAWADLRARIKKLNARQAPPAVRKMTNLALVGLLGLVSYGKLWGANSPVIVDPLMASRYPLGALDWIRQNHPAGRMLSEYKWGGYFAFALRDYPVFVDGRTDLFGDEILEQWLKVVRADPGWQDVLTRWNVNLVLIDPATPLANMLPLTGWKLLYRDAYSLLYGR